MKRPQIKKDQPPTATKGHRTMKFDPEIRIICHPEDCPIRGNAMASGDDDVDKAVEDVIIEKLESNPWAWCCVEVEASFMGLSASEYLGCCSYESEEDFKQGGYFEDLTSEATSQLRDMLIEIRETDIDWSDLRDVDVED